jgi:hypothetical protein
MFFWRGIYKCINEQCYSSFNCIIKDEPTHGGSILITWPKIRIHHEKLKKVFKIKIVSNFFLNFCFKNKQPKIYLFMETRWLEIKTF